MTQAISTRAGRRGYARVLIPVLVGAVAAAVVWSLGPFGRGDSTVHASFDAPVYSSVEELTSASDIVVIGTVTAVVGRETDFGTNNLSERVGDGIPVVFYEVESSEVLKGTTDSTTIIVGNPDGEKLGSEDVTPLEVGQEVMLFLRAQTAAKDAPGITLFDSFYTTLSLDNGIFDMDGEVAHPRTPGLFGDTATVSFPMDDIRTQISNG
ncbi:MAG: hypothetical protein OEX97_14555 [Acidimicrobiia bacterium]|nr:hypothetical protein [Gemmatimonadota bacterium]MDH3570476.1 hypothetical protein [Gemmatimonadota bacterium]MDH5374163.1 hypothetical protein [Acidimicrobiia bacterium]MDH5615056.1 hypothetical protein [Acidimicrobiia bacterium]